MHVCGVYVICMFECVMFGVCVVHTHVSRSTCGLQRPTSKSWWKSLLVFLLCCICQASQFVNFTSHLTRGVQMAALASGSSGLPD